MTDEQYLSCNIETTYKCFSTNKVFSNFIYLNAGWLTTEKCPWCQEYIKTDGSNYKQFWDNHKEVQDD